MERVWIAILVFGALGLMAWLSFPLFQGEMYTEDDCGAFHLPLRAFYQRCLQQGDSFLWMPGIFNGFYLHGEGQAAMLHPFNYIIYRYLPLPTAFMLEILHSYPMMFLGMYLFLRRWALPHSGSLLGGLLLTFVGATLNHYIHVHCVAAFVHLPWNLLAIDWVMRPRGRYARASGIGLLILSSALQLFEGAPQYTSYTWLPEGAYALVLLWTTRSWGAFLLLGLAKLSAILVSGAQILPMWDALAQSYRAAPDTQFQLSISLHPLNLLQWLNPYLFQRRVFAPFKGDEPWDAPYLGAIAVPLVVFLLLRLRRDHPRFPLMCWALGLLVFGLLAALGRYGFLHPLLTAIPVLDKLRAPARYMAVAHAGMALAAALGWAELVSARNGIRTMSRRETWIVAFLPCAGLLATLSLVVLRYWGTGMIGASLERQLMPWPALALGWGLSAAACGLTILGGRGSRPALAVLLLLTLGDIGLYSLRHKPHQTLEAYLGEISLPPAPPGARIDSDIHPMYMNRYSMAGYRGVYGYAALSPARHLDYTQEPALRVAGVTWREARHCATPRLNASKERGERWVALDGAAPRARLLTRSIVSTDPAAVLEQVNLMDTAVVNAPLPLEEGPPGEADVLVDRPGRIDVRVHAPTGQLLVISERYEPGWKAHCGARELPILPVYGDFLGVMVTPGDSVVEWRFAPASYRAGWWVTLLGVGASIVFVGILIACARRSPEATATS